MPVKLFWWNKKANFGDAISPLIVERISGRRVEYADAAHCELVAIGSVLHLVARAANNGLGPAKAIWGSGVFEASEHVERMARSDHVQINAVRGPLTAAFLKIDRSIPFGDPGILCDRVFERPIVAVAEVGIVPHISHWRSDEYIAKLTAVEDSKVIDVRNPDPIAVVNDIASCEVVFSSSLHGLIVADSYRVPNLWLRGPSLDQVDLKFFDYALSSGRPKLKPYSIEECLSIVRGGNVDSQMAPCADIEAVKDSLIAQFPSHLAVGL